MNDRVDWYAEYNRLCQLFREKWGSQGMNQIVEAIHAVAFRGADESAVSEATVLQGDTLVVNERNLRAVADFGEAIPADMRTYNRLHFTLLI